MIFINLQSKTHPIRHHHRETHGISANLKIDVFFWGGGLGGYWEVLGGFEEAFETDFKTALLPI